MGGRRQPQSWCLAGRLEAAAAANKEQPPFCKAGPGAAAAAAPSGTERGGRGVPGGARSRPAPRGVRGGAGREVPRGRCGRVPPAAGNAAPSGRPEEQLRSESPGTACGARREKALPSPLPCSCADRPDPNPDPGTMEPPPRSALCRTPRAEQEEGRRGLPLQI